MHVIRFGGCLLRSNYAEVRRNCDRSHGRAEKKSHVLSLQEKPLICRPDDGTVVVSVKRSTDTVAPAPAHMTVDEYFRTPVTLKPMELIYGVLRVNESPAVCHQSAVAQLFLALHRHVRGRGLGQVWLSPLDVVLDHDRALIMQPDLFFVSRERSWIVGHRICGAPDLVIEVLSPHPRIGKTDERVRLFAQHGVRECWLVHQDKQKIVVLDFENGRVPRQRIHGTADPVASRVLPDFSMAWDDIFADN
jgi:Uma2 family endonuclease